MNLVLILNQEAKKKKEEEGGWQDAYVFKLTNGNDSYLNYCDSDGIEAFSIFQLLKERGRKIFHQTLS